MISWKIFLEWKRRKHSPSKLESEEVARPARTDRDPPGISSSLSESGEPKTHESTDRSADESSAGLGDNG